MNRIFLVLVAVLIFVSCESREEKIQKAISQELKGVLYDFDSYEPVKTKIDSAFSSGCVDSEVVSLFSSFCKSAKELDEAKCNYNEALSAVAIWDVSYKSAFISQQEKKSMAERDAALRKIEDIQIRLKSDLKEIYERINQFNGKDKKFVGWLVKQRYKCKTRGGYPSFGDDVFVFNGDITDCILYMSSEEYEALCSFVNQLKSVPEDKFAKIINDLDVLRE